MKNTLKQLYNIDSKALIKYSDKVYEIKDVNDNKYCLKYTDCNCNNLLIESADASKGDFCLPCFSLAKTLHKSPMAIADEISRKLDLKISLKVI